MRVFEWADLSCERTLFLELTLAEYSAFFATDATFLRSLAAGLGILTGGRLLTFFSSFGLCITGEGFFSSTG
jgi:hypothetical protein